MVKVGPELHLILDSIIIILLFVLLYLIYRRLVSPMFSHPKQARAALHLTDEQQTIALIEARAKLRGEISDLQREYDAGKVDDHSYKEKGKKLLWALKTVEKELSAMGLL